jgi:molecular chaperone GrpE
MPKKIETESDVGEQEKEAEDVEIEYLTEQNKAPKKRKVESKDAKLRKKEDEIKKLQHECENLRQEYLRQVADKENLRKRLEKEKQDFYQYALSDLLLEILGVLDNFERALESKGKTKSKSLQEGVEMIYRQLLEILRKNGVKPIDLDEKAFNPHLHQAFMSEESEEVSEPTVGEVFQKGYTIHDRLLRPSLVKVLTPKKE